MVNSWSYRLSENMFVAIMVIVCGRHGLWPSLLNPMNSIHCLHINDGRWCSSVLWCFWLGLLTCKTHYRVGEPTIAWQFVNIRQHLSFDNGWQYVSCGQRQPPLSGAPVNKMAANYHDGETDPSGFRVWWNSSSLRDIFVPPYRQCLTGSSWQQQQQNDGRCWPVSVIYWMCDCVCTEAWLSCLKYSRLMVIRSCLIGGTTSSKLSSAFLTTWNIQNLSMR